MIHTLPFCLPPKRPAQALREIAWLADDFRHLLERDPALRHKRLGWLEALTYPGLWALAAHRMAHVLATASVPVVPRVISQAARFFTGIEIHPGARIGPGLFIDHGAGVVIGETVEIGAHVLMFHQVTLGNIDVDAACKRHPSVGDHVVIGAGAKVLGPICVGHRARIGAGTVVIRDVPEGALVVGPVGQLVERPHLHVA